MVKYSKNQTVYTQINFKIKISQQFMLCVVQISSVQTLLNPPFVMFPQVRALLEAW